MEGQEAVLPIFVSPGLSSVRDNVIILYVVCTLYVVCVCMYVRSMCMYVVFCNIDHCIHIHWYIPMGLGHNDPWVESHMWPQQTWGQRSSRVNDLWFKFLEKRVSVSTYFDVFSNLILQWLQKYVIAKAGETRGSRTALYCYVITKHVDCGLGAGIYYLRNSKVVLFNSWLQEYHSLLNVPSSSYRHLPLSCTAPALVVPM